MASGDQRFETAVREAFRFLVERGFTVTSEHNGGHRPQRVVVRFEGPAVATVESELTNASTVSTFVRADDGDHLLGPRSAYKAEDLKTALAEHAAEVRALLP